MGDLVCFGDGGMQYTYISYIHKSEQVSRDSEISRLKPVSVSQLLPRWCDDVKDRADEDAGFDNCADLGPRLDCVPRERKISV